MTLRKKEMEELISKEKTLGRYVFDESNNAFLADAEIVIYITQVNVGKYRTVCYFFDGYEIYLDENEVEYFEGDEEAAKAMAIRSFQQDTFMGFPISYSNIVCQLYEDEV